MPSSPKVDPRRRLPALDRLLAATRVAALARVYGRDAVTVQARRVLDEARRRLAETPGDASAADDLERRVEEALARRLGAPTRRVLNATGVFLHTNLGRAPLPGDVADALPSRLSAACDLEIDLESGRRGDRLARLAPLLAELTGAEAALAVNNNAAALVLAFAALAPGREVVVSRGELVEIGDSFRIPDILAASGARLVEVGSTNRTHLADYERAIGDGTALLLKVHTSNYRVRGFVSAVATDELAALAGARGLALVVDEGAGLLRRSGRPQLAEHPSFAELLAAGAHLVTGSGDKLLGGPQAGLVAGRRELVERLRRHPLYRALRLGRTAACALDDVLRRHLRGEPLPIDRLWVAAADHRPRLERAATALGAEIVPADAFVGGGAAPDEPIAGEALALPGDDELARRLRTGSTPVVGYLREGRLLLDLRTIAPEDDAALVGAVRAALG